MSLTRSVWQQTSAETARHSPWETTIILHYTGHPMPLLQASLVSKLCLHYSVSWLRQQLYHVQFEIGFVLRASMSVPPAQVCAAPADVLGSPV